ncbi:hypothetical protein DAEQUDRAFT_725969 [Daedalea quercina L-15889]|uniref:Uncharacterized protein n=1 Tax=Daedalea quercina L-15889 TaxID=1314783 RepID=A0A165QVF4_9APHY|nr:hypothetical protein DAEQUDRAFT_725969 [Daedalea quercina L-15889]
MGARHDWGGSMRQEEVERDSLVPAPIRLPDRGKAPRRRRCLFLDLLGSLQPAPAPPSSVFALHIRRAGGPPSVASHLSFSAHAPLAMSPLSSHVQSPNHRADRRAVHWQELYPRKGAGGKGGHSSGDGDGSSSSSSSSDGSSSGKSGSSAKTKSVPISGATGGRTTAEAYGAGGGAVSTIPAGQLFAGRSVGGGARSQVFGTRVYGSGYPGLAGGTVAGRGFPFLFWPVVWGPYPGYGPYYLHSTEYGRPDNTSRPGGALAEATFASNSTNSTFVVVADNSTVAALIASVSANCTLGGASSAAPAPFNATTGAPRPEQAVQYYRASSVVLLLDGYNDTSALGNDTDATAVALPGWVDRTLLTCLNDTIGEAVPLISGAGDRLCAPHLGGLVALVLVVWRLLGV